MQHEDDASAVDVGRRRALRVAGAAVTALAALGAGGTLRVLVPEERMLPPLRAGRVGDFPPHSVRLLPTAPIYILHEEEGFAALSARCPHLGCLVQRRGDGFLCPCHGSEFDAQGGYVRGAARRGLVWLGVEVVDGVLVVHPSIGVRQGTFVHG